MILQIAIGSTLILISTLFAGAGYLWLEAMLARLQSWLLKPPHALKLLALLVGSMVWVLLIVAISVWIWAIALYLLGVFITMEGSVYFSIVAFTTLGFGDILLPHQWRLLAGMSAINGLVMIGLLTAVLVEVLRRVRAIQSETRNWSA